ncbi:MAG: nickel-type superoxide dismutase maturation protease [Myxococcota bacterium]|nr:nickel-type superoxide dismutase maturation protease [Myxococcota bacterium]
MLVLLRRRKRYRVNGASMAPILLPGDTVFVVPNPYARREPSIGDIVVAHHPFEHRTIVKRIHQLVDHGVILRGDNPAESTDSRSLGHFPITALIGRVVARI